MPLDSEDSYEAHEEAVKEAQRRHITQKRQRRADFRAVFSGEHGERVLKYLFKVCMTDNASSLDGDTAKHMRGRSWVLKHILETRNMDDEQLARLIKEIQ